jgi:cysteine desulfurase / selenocysteine lyase
MIKELPTANEKTKPVKKLDSAKIAKDFPILSREVNGHQLVYLDNAATSQKPESVIKALSHYYEYYNANIHRGLHTLSEEATTAYEDTREKIRAFIDAPSEREVIFTRNTTEAINLVLNSWGKHHIKAGDEIVISAMEHHSNHVTWQQLALEQGATLRFIELTKDGQFDLKQAATVIGVKTKLVAITQMSNVLGTITPVKEIVKLARQHGAIVLLDGAQGVPHLPTSVKDLDVDFLAFSFHKMLGPTGVGVLWGRAELLEKMPPFMFGGDMISSVHRDRTKFNELPWKFEAGTPNIADVIACGAALDYLNDLGMDAVRQHEIEITAYALERLKEFDDIKIYGPTDPNIKGGVISFTFETIHPHDLGQLLNESAVAIRAGHHCCQPLMNDLGVSGTARASFYIYNTNEDVDKFIEALREAKRVFGHVASR